MSSLKVSLKHEICRHRNALVSNNLAREHEELIKGSLDTEKKTFATRDLKVSKDT